MARFFSLLVAAAVLLALAFAAPAAAQVEVDFTVRLHGNYSLGANHTVWNETDFLVASGNVGVTVCSGLGAPGAESVLFHLQNSVLNPQGNPYAMMYTANATVRVFPNENCHEDARSILVASQGRVFGLGDSGVQTFDFVDTTQVPGFSVHNTWSVVAVIPGLSSSTGGDVSSSTGGAGNGGAVDPSVGTRHLGQIALGCSLALVFVASLLACALRKRCASGSHINKEPHSVQQHGAYNSMA